MKENLSEKEIKIKNKIDKKKLIYNQIKNCERISLKVRCEAAISFCLISFYFVTIIHNKINY